MKILIANLKQLYQRRSLWLIYASLGYFTWLQISISLRLHSIDRLIGRSSAEAHRSINFLFWAAVVGAGAAWLQIEVLNKPFAFCLPRQRQSVRMFVFFVAIAANMASCAASSISSEVADSHELILLGSCFFAGLTVSLMLAWLTLRFGYAILSVFGIGFPVFMMASDSGRVYEFLQQVIFECPLFVTAEGIVVSLLVWLSFADENLARRHCRTSGGPKTRQAGSGRVNWEKLKDHPRPWVEELFMERMTRHGSFATGRFLWGSLYTSFSLFLSQWRTFSLIILIGTIFLGYMGRVLWMAFIFVPLMSLNGYPSTLYSNMLGTAGRSERLRSTLVVTLTTAGLMVGLFTAAVALSFPLTVVLPPFHYKSLTLTYHAMDFRILCVPLILLPIVGVLRLVFHKKQAQIMMVLFMLFPLVIIPLSRSEWPLGALIDPQIILVLTTLCWLIFATVLRHIALRRCLVK
jgi:hypothetical protein